MLKEQIIEFKLKGFGPPGRTCTPTTGDFHDKTIISEGNLRVDHYLLLKYFRRQCNVLLSTWAKSLTKFNPKCAILNLFWSLNCK